MSSPVDTEALACQELVELVTDYLEGALAPGELQRFEGHIAGCGNCRRYLVQLRATIELTGTLTPDDLTSEAEDLLLETFRGWRDSVPRSP